MWSEQTPSLYLFFTDGTDLQDLTKHVILLRFSFFEKKDMMVNFMCNVTGL